MLYTEVTVYYVSGKKSLLFFNFFNFDNGKLQFTSAEFSRYSTK